MVANINSHFEAILMDGASALRIKSNAIKETSTPSEPLEVIPVFNGVDFSCESNISYMLYKGQS